MINYHLLKGKLKKKKIFTLKAEHNSNKTVDKIYNGPPWTLRSISYVIKFNLSAKKVI